MTKTIFKGIKENGMRVMTTLKHSLRNLKKRKSDEKEIVRAGIAVAKKLAEEYHDAASAIAVLRLCKAVAGDALEITIRR